MNDEQQNLDVLIVGGGPAGMAAALVAGRARLQTLVLNAETPRNNITAASHGFLTRDGAHPTELLDAAKEQLRKYDSVRYQLGRATTIERLDAGFRVTAATGEHWLTKRLILATGYVDDITRLSLPGIRAVYGQSVFPCPFCDGFEHADQRIAVFGAEGVEHFIPVVRIWSDDVALFTNGRPVKPSVVEMLALRGVRVHPQRVVRLHSEEGVLTLVELEDGSLIPRDAGFIGDDFSVPSTDFATELGVAQAPNAWGGLQFETDEAGRTAIAGLYVIGDARSGWGGLMAAAFEGSNCAEHIVHEIATERWHRTTSDTPSREESGSKARKARP